MQFWTNKLMSDVYKKVNSFALRRQSRRKYTTTKDRKKEVFRLCFQEQTFYLTIQ